MYLTSNFVTGDNGSGQLGRGNKYFDLLPAPVARPMNCSASYVITRNLVDPCSCSLARVDSAQSASALRPAFGRFWGGVDGALCGNVSQTMWLVLSETVGDVSRQQTIVQTSAPSSQDTGPDTGILVFGLVFLALLAACAVGLFVYKRRKVAAAQEATQAGTIL